MTKYLLLFSIILGLSLTGCVKNNDAKDEATKETVESTATAVAEEAVEEPAEKPAEKPVEKPANEGADISEVSEQPVAAESATAAAETTAEMGEPLDMDKLSFVFGYMQGSNLVMLREEMKVPVNDAKLLEGFDAGAAGEEPPMTEQEMQQEMMGFQQAMMQVQQQPGADGAELLKNVDMDKVMYLMGYMQTAELSKLEEMGVSINLEQLRKGITDAFSGKSAGLSGEEMQALVMAFQREMMTKQQEMMAQQQQAMAGQADENKAKGEAFLAENKTRDGVKVTDSGLQYMVLEEGDGASPEATSKVKVHYKGTLIDGTVFDSTYDRGEPIEFPLSGVIKGWTEGLQLMKVGSKYRFFIPSDLAYGANAPASIGPNQVLIFDVELLDIPE